MVTTALKMLFIEKKKAMSLVFNLAIMICLSGVMLNMLENPKMQIIYLFINDVANFLSILYFFLIIICIWLVAYSCLYYIRINSREFALIRLAGYDFLQLVKYMVIQNLMIVLMAAILGYLMMVVLIPVVQMIIYSYVGMNYNIFYISWSAIYQSFLLLLLTTVIMVFLDIYYINRMSIPEMLKMHNIVSYKTDKRLIKIPKILFVVLYLIGLIILFNSDDLSFGTILICIIGVIGVYGILYYIIPDYLQARIDNKKLKPLDYVVSGNVSLFLQQTKMIIMLILITVIVFPIVILITSVYPLYHIQVHIIFVLVNVLTWMTLYSRFKLDFQEKGTLYQNLYKIGLTTKELKIVSYKEIISIFKTILILSGVYLTVIIFKLIQANANYYSLVVVLTEYFIPLLICLIWLLNKRRKEIYLWKK